MENEQLSPIANLDLSEILESCKFGLRIHLEKHKVFLSNSYPLLQSICKRARPFQVEVIDC